MIKLILNNFKRTNDCIILATPMVLFMIITVVYSSFIATHAKTVNLALFSLITLLIMVSGLMAGWFYMVKKTLKLSDRTFVYENDRIKALRDLVLTLPNGVGRLFTSFLGFIIISIFATVFAYYLIIGLIPVDKLQNLADFLFFNNYITALLFIISSVLSFFGMLWIPEMVYNEKNPFKALVNSLIITFKTFPKTLSLYVFIYLIYFVNMFAIQYLTPYPILVFILLVLYYYFLLYIVILVFTYYEHLKQS